jgi:hypothetical protein
MEQFAQPFSSTTLVRIIFVLGGMIFATGLSVYFRFDWQIALSQ